MPKTTPIQLVRNELLVDITDKLGTQPVPDEKTWEKLAKRFKQTETYKNSGYDDGRLASALSETYVSMFLENMHQQYGSRVRLNPLKNKVKRSNHGKKNIFWFKHMMDAVHVYKKDNVYSEIDDLAVIDGLPVLFEIKLIRYANKAKSVATPGGRGTRHAMQPERIEYLFQPLVEPFKTNEFGYVLIVSPDQVNPQSPLQRQFTESGGIIVPFFMEKGEYSSYITDQIKQQHDLEPRFNTGLRGLQRILKGGK